MFMCHCTLVHTLHTSNSMFIHRFHNIDKCPQFSLFEITVFSNWFYSLYLMKNASNLNFCSPKKCANHRMGPFYRGKKCRPQAKRVNGNWSIEGDERKKTFNYEIKSERAWHILHAWNILSKGPIVCKIQRPILIRDIFFSLLFSEHHQYRREDNVSWRKKMFAFCFTSSESTESMKSNGVCMTTGSYEMFLCIPMAWCPVYKVKVCKMQSV